MTPTQKRMLTLLADGKKHHLRELHALLDDELSARSTVYVHVHNLRKALPAGARILCERVYSYRYVPPITGS